MQHLCRKVNDGVCREPGPRFLHEERAIRKPFEKSAIISPPKIRPGGGMFDPELTLVGDNGKESTESIVLEGLFAKSAEAKSRIHLGKLHAASFGKLLHTLPMPALLVNEVNEITFANMACDNFISNHMHIHGERFDDLFSNPYDPGRIAIMLHQVLLERKPIVSEGILEINKKRFWARMHLRSLRVEKTLSILVLVEDLTSEKRQLLLTKRHEDALRRARDELEKRVEQRTAELLRINEQLKEEILQRKRAEEELRQTEERYRTLVEDSFDGIFVHKRGKIVFANSKLYQMLGYGKGELEGRDYWDIFYLDHEQTIKQWATPQGGDKVPAQYHIRLQRKNGSFFDVEICARAIHFESGPGIQVCVRDIADRKRSEELMLQTERIKAIAEMAGGVAHNFNNLLQIVMSGAQAALTQLDSGNHEAIRINLDRIIESSLFGSETVRRLQDFAHIRSDKIKKGAKVFDLAQTVQQAINVSEPWWRTNPEKEGIKVTLTHELNPECLIEGMENELFEVCVNLVKNSAEALPFGGEIHLRTFVRQDYVLLEVQDTGIGIPKENLGKVFQPFWTTKGFQGTGMGLASTFGIVKRHEGDISLISEEGEGTAITVRLPLSAKPLQSPQLRPSSASGSMLRILVIDDMEQAAVMLQEGLKELGHDVQMSLSGKEGLQFVSHNPVDVIICDLGMPEMNGWQVGKALTMLCMNNKKAKIPFVLLTGWGGQINEGEKIIDCGVDRVVEKPVILSKLLEVVRDVVKA